MNSFEDCVRFWIKQSNTGANSYAALSTHAATVERSRLIAWLSYGFRPKRSVHRPQTGEVRTAQLFIATLGASNYFYVEASWTQTLPDWISSHVRTFDFFGGVAAQVVPDNLKTGVTKACISDPAINRTYGDMVHHYDTAIVPARPNKPKDKAKVEGAVLLVERWIMARLRNQLFFSLDELNAAIRPLLDQLNNKVTRHLGASLRIPESSGH